MGECCALAVVVAAAHARELGPVLEGGGRVVIHHQALPAADEIEQHGSRPVGPMVLGRFVRVDQHGDVVALERFRTGVAELLGDAGFEDAGGIEVLAHQRRGAAPIVIVAAGDDQHLDLARRRRLLRPCGQTRGEKNQDAAVHTDSPHAGSTISRSGSKWMRRLCS